MNRSELMSRIKSKGNLSTEIAMMEWMRQRSVKGWRRHIKVMGIDVDFYFPSTRTCLFVDGCFWHACPKHMTFEKAMKLPTYWYKKILTNKARDARQEQKLKDNKYNVWRVWEHALIKGDI
jgi:DNA mismatch endonuclease, patch repair protein